MDKGERIGAILGAKGDTLEFLGFGVYEGELVVGDEAVGPFAEMLREQKRPNPRMRLDDGQIVYGCECWWGPEEKIKEKLAEYKTIVNVSIADARERATKQKEAQ